MKIGIPEEIKNNEYRVGMTPAGVREVCAHGHQVLIEQNAGIGIGKSDDDYRRAGTEILTTAEAVFAQADMIVKVKEPLPQACARLRPGQILFTYLHLAPDPMQAELLMRSGAIAIAYETVTDTMGRLPLLAPMSEAAGRMAVQVGAHALEKAAGGAGILLAGVPGVAAAKVAVLGEGVVGLNAARLAMGLGADITIPDKSLPRLAEIDGLYGPQLKTLYATTESIEESVFAADLTIGAVLVPGASASKLVTKDMLQHMKAGSVLVDVAIDQGGLLRNRLCHRPCRTRLYRRRYCALLRCQHARRSGAHLDFRTDQRNTTLYPASGQSGLERSTESRHQFPQWSKCRQWSHHLPRCRRSAGR